MTKKKRYKSTDRDKFVKRFLSICFCLLSVLLADAGPRLERIEIDVQFGPKAADKIVKVINQSEEEEILEDKNVLMKLKKILIPGLKNDTTSSSSSSSKDTSSSGTSSSSGSSSNKKSSMSNKSSQYSSSSSSSNSDTDNSKESSHSSSYSSFNSRSKVREHLCT